VPRSRPRSPLVIPYALALGLSIYPLVTACTPGSDRDRPDAAQSASAVKPAAPSAAPPVVPASAQSTFDAGPPDAGPGASDDPMAIHVESKEDLLALFSIKPRKKRGDDPAIFLGKAFGADGPSHINQGNKAIARHAVSKAKCLAGLEGITLQTEEQRGICGFENMVPIYKRGRKKPKTCIDIFEFPNKPCELPMVWAAPIQAKIICEMQGKRLCSQEEWTLACRGDPEGGKDRKFAYGDEMDLEVCNTNKPAKENSPDCDGKSASSAWKTCGTNTEPTGAYPRCRSRFGVFDQHGNVAEIMTRLDADGHVYSQLKGSAFFYVDVARKPNERQQKGRETYPDHCAYDPRWHVEQMNEAWHVNYHLGFRCCSTVH